MFSCARSNEQDLWIKIEALKIAAILKHNKKILTIQVIEEDILLRTNISFTLKYYKTISGLKKNENGLCLKFKFAFSIFEQNSKIHKSIVNFSPSSGIVQYNTVVTVVTSCKGEQVADFFVVSYRRHKGPLYNKTYKVI